MRIGLALAALALLGACGEEPDTGGLTAEESRELDEAANMLDTAPAVEGEEALVGEAETAAAGNAQ
jgi:hypothetical protein